MESKLEAEGIDPPWYQWSNICEIQILARASCCKKIWKFKRKNIAASSKGYKERGEVKGFLGRVRETNENLTPRETQKAKIRHSVLEGGSIV